MGQVLLPFAPFLQVVVGNIKRGITPRAKWLVEQFHPGLLRGSARFAAITGYTGANQIFPHMLATLVSR